MALSIGVIYPYFRLLSMGAYCTYFAPKPTALSGAGNSRANLYLGVLWLPENKRRETMRNIPKEMAELARERGAGMTEAELRAEGFTKNEIAKHATEAAEMLRAAETARAA